MAELCLNYEGLLAVWHLLINVQDSRRALLLFYHYYLFYINNEKSYKTYI